MMSDGGMAEGGKAGEVARGKAASRTWGWVIAQVVLLAALALWLASGRPIGIPGVWAWEVKAKPLRWDALVRVLLFGAGMIGLCALGAWRIRMRRRSDAAILAGLVLLAFALQLSVASLAPMSSFMLIAGSASQVSTEYFNAAWTLIDYSDAGLQLPAARNFCRNFASYMRDGRHHIATHPPGAVLVYWALLQLYRSPSFPGGAFSKLTEFIVGARRTEIAEAARSYPTAQLSGEAVGPALFCCLALGLCGALALIPLYYLTRKVASRRAALVVCSLFALTPAQLLFFQGLDSLLLLLVVLAWAWTVASLASAGGPRSGPTLRRCWPALAAGAVLGVACLISFGALAAIGVALLLAGAWAVRAERAARPAAWQTVGVLLAGCAVVVLAGDAACGWRLPTIFRQAMAAHRQFTWVEHHRTYGTWVGLDLVEFLCFLGLPVLVVASGAAWAAVRGGWKAWSLPDLNGLSGAAVFLALDVSGSVRGEVGRVWLFLMPPLVLWDGCSMARGARLALWTGLLTLAQVVILGLALTPVVTPF